MKDAIFLVEFDGIPKTGIAINILVSVIVHSLKKGE
jgi:hypothetical protein